MEFFHGVDFKILLKSAVNVKEKLDDHKKKI